MSTKGTTTTATNQPSNPSFGRAYAVQESSSPKSTDAAIRRLGNCGLFQVLLTFTVLAVEAPAIWSTMFMAFGNFNPGWVCVDENNGSLAQTDLNMSLTTDTTVSYDSYATSSERRTLQTSTEVAVISQTSIEVETPPATCADYSHSRCGSLQFLQNTSTIVTEWALICDRNWIVNLITSFGMAGSMVGNFVGGQFSDRFGRKPVLYVASALNGALNGLSLFANAWVPYAGFRFFLGLTSGVIITVHIVHVLEFTSALWRPMVAVIPCWNVSSALLAVIAMWLRDWRSLHIVAAVVGLVLCCTAFWVPESLRWLVVNGKVSTAHSLTARMAWWNRSPRLAFHAVDSIVRDERDNIQSTNFSVKHLFMNGQAKKSLILIIVWVLLNMMYYSINFGVKAISGNLYVNLILFQIVPLPFMAISALLANTFGRKWAVIVFLSLASLCCVGAALVNLLVEPKTKSGTTILVLALVASSSIAGSWAILNTFSVELYPTVIRLLAYGFLNAGSRVGAILAPFLIPGKTENLHVSYLVMGGLGLGGCALLCLLPETKDAPMTDTAQGSSVSTASKGDNIVFCNRPVLGITMADTAQGGAVSTEPKSKEDNCLL